MPIPASIFSRTAQFSRNAQAVRSADLVKRGRYERASIYSGGFLMDLVDTINAPLYAIGGMIQGEGVWKGIKRRRMASEAFGMEAKGVGGFVKSLGVDILADPLTYMTFGVSSVLKAGGVKVAGKSLSRAGAKRLAGIEGGLIAAKSATKYSKLKSALKGLGVDTIEELAPKARTEVLKTAGISQTERSAIRNKAVDQILTEMDSPTHEFLERAGIWIDIPFVQASKKIVEYPSIFRAGGRGLADVGRKVLSPIIPYARIKNIPDNILSYGNKIRLVRAVKDLNMEVAAGRSDTIELVANLEKKFGREVMDAVPDIVEEVFRDVARVRKANIRIPIHTMDSAVDLAIKEGAISAKNATKLKMAVPEIQNIINAGKDIRLRYTLLDNLITDIGYVPRTKGEVSSLRAMVSGTIGKQPRQLHRKYFTAFNPDGAKFVAAKRAGRWFNTKTGEPVSFISKRQVAEKIGKIERLAGRKVGKIETQVKGMVKRVEKVEEMIDTMKGGVRKITKEGKELTFEQVRKARKAALLRQKTFLGELQTVADEDVVKGVAEKLKTKMPELTKEQEKIIKELNKEITKIRKAAEKVAKEGFDEKTVKRIKELIREKLNIAKRAEKRTETIKKIKKEAEGKVGAIKKKYGEGDVIVNKKGKVFSVMSATKKEMKEAGIDVLEDRFAIPVAKYRSESMRIKATGKFLKKLSDDILKDADPTTSFGMLDARNARMGEPIREGYVNLGKLLDQKEFSGTEIPAEVADALKGFLKINTEKESKIMLKAFDTAQNWWKSFALVAFAYHGRNVITNFINAGLGGLADGTMYVKAGKIQLGDKLGKMSKESAEIFHHAKKYDVVRTGFYGAELTQSLADALSKPGFNPLSLNRRNALFGTQGGLARGSRALGMMFEDNARLALFMDRVKKGDTFSDAASHVKKFLFDYGELTPFERNTLRRLIPFYSWTRKNIPLQFEMLVKEPRKGISILKTENAVENAVYEPDEQADIIAALPEWQREGHPIILPFKDKDGNPVIVQGEGFLPIYDLSRIGFKKTFDELVSMLSPIIKTPLLEMPFNKSLFTGKRLDYTEKEDAFLYGKLFDGAFGGYFGEEYTRSKFLYRGLMNETQAQIIKSFYRPLREIDNLFELGKTPEEKNSLTTRWSAFLISKARPIDVFEGKGYNEWLGKEEKGELVKQYQRSYKNYLRYENELDATNMDILRNKIIREFDVEEGEIEQAEVSAFRTFLKWETLQDLVRESVKTGKPIPVEERNKIIRQLANSYKDKSAKRAINAYNKIVEEVKSKLK